MEPPEMTGLVSRHWAEAPIVVFVPQALAATTGS